MEDRTLIRIGGLGALAVAVTQAVGNGLHPPIPHDTVQALTVIHNTMPWIVVHIIITVSYFLFIPFVVGTQPAFRNNPALVRVGTPLVIAGAIIGAVQITTHLTLFHHLGQIYPTGDSALQATVILMFESLWPYSVALEISHLLAIFIAILLFGIAMLKETNFPRWVAIMGIIAGALAATAILVGKFVITGRTGDLVFGASLLPLVVWIVATGVVLLRLAARMPANP
jgi:hypothetical protein